MFKRPCIRPAKMAADRQTKKRKMRSAEASFLVGLFGAPPFLVGQCNQGDRYATKGQNADGLT